MPEPHYIIRDFRVPGALDAANKHVAGDRRRVIRRPSHLS